MNNNLYINEEWYLCFNYDHYTQVDEWRWECVWFDIKKYKVNSEWKFEEVK